MAKEKIKVYTLYVSVATTIDGYSRHAQKSRTTWNLMIMKLLRG